MAVSNRVLIDIAAAIARFTFDSTGRISKIAVRALIAVSASISRWAFGTEGLASNDGTTTAFWTRARLAIVHILLRSISVVTIRASIAIGASRMMQANAHT